MCICACVYVALRLQLLRVGERSPLLLLVLLLLLLLLLWRPSRPRTRVLRFPGGAFQQSANPTTSCSHPPPCSLPPRPAPTPPFAGIPSDWNLQVHRDEGSASVIISAPQAFAAHASPVTVAVFSPSGDRLVTCDGTGVVLLWSNLAAPVPEAWETPPAVAAASAAAAAAAAAEVMEAVAAAMTGRGAVGVRADGGLKLELEAIESEAAEAEAEAGAEAAVAAVAAVRGGGRDGGGGRASLRPEDRERKVPWFLDEREEDGADGEGQEEEGQEDIFVGKTAGQSAAPEVVAAAGDWASMTQGGAKEEGRGFASILDQTPPPGIALVRGGYRRRNVGTRVARFLLFSTRYRLWQPLAAGTFAAEGAGSGDGGTAVAVLLLLLLLLLVLLLLLPLLRVVAAAAAGACAAFCCCCYCYWCCCSCCCS